MHRPLLLTLGIGAFVLLLLYTTLRSTDTPLDRPPEEREQAQTACQKSVRESLPGARFPFTANFEDLPEGRLRLSGSVDSGPSDQPVRRNYECFLRPDASGYVADSIWVWQSH